MNYILTSSGELYHYGVKGMKWGVRKAQKKVSKFGEEGSKKTTRLLEKAARGGTEKRIRKFLSKYDKSVANDIELAYKAGDKKTAKALISGRTYLKSQTDRDFMTRIITDAANRVDVGQAEYLVHEIIRSKELGGVIVKINDQDGGVYMYNPNGRNRNKDFTRRDTDNTQSVKSEEPRSRRSKETKALKSYDSEAKLEAINQKWEKKFEGYDNWEDSPDYIDYVNEVLDAMYED